MTSFYEFVATTLADRSIDEAEVPLIRQSLYEDGQLDLADVKLLVELYCGATKRCAEFDDLFFSTLEEVILADGQIQQAEQFYLLKMLYSDHQITEREKEFLLHLRNRATTTTPEFDALCDTALSANPTGWSLGGR